LSVRVTQGMMSAQLLRNISNNVSKMDQLSNQQSTGRKINKPSDDPIGVSYALRYRSEISVNEQYQRNIDMASSSLEHTDTVLGQINEVLQRANELTVKGVTGTNPQSALDAISKELDELYNSLITLGNDQLNGKYIFNGQKNDIKPYDTGVESTDNGKIEAQFGSGVTASINVTGNEVFGNGTDVDNVFTVVKGIKDALAAGNTNLARSYMDSLTSRMNKVQQVRSEVGARANRVELMDNRLKDLNVNLESLSGKTEDADMADVIIKLQLSENVYQASLSSGAKIIQPSLMDYMR